MDRSTNQALIREVEAIISEFRKQQPSKSVIREAWETLVLRSVLSEEQGPGASEHRYFKHYYGNNPPAVGPDLGFEPPTLYFLELWASIGKERIAWAEEMVRVIGCNYSIQVHDILWDTTGFALTEGFTLGTNRRLYTINSGLSRKENKEYWALVDRGMRLDTIRDEYGIGNLAHLTLSRSYYS